MNADDDRLFGLVMDFRGNSIADQIPSQPSEDGTTWVACRVVAVDSEVLLEQLGYRLDMRTSALEGKPFLALRDDDLREHDHRWSYWEVGAAIPDRPSMAAALARRQLLAGPAPDFPVVGCVVWIGASRYWVAFETPWPASQRPSGVIPLPYDDQAGRSHPPS